VTNDVTPPSQRQNERHTAPLRRRDWGGGRRRRSVETTRGLAAATNPDTATPICGRRLDGVTPNPIPQCDDAITPQTGVSRANTSDLLLVMSDMTTRTTDIEVPAAVIDDVARRLDETDTDPEPAAVRDWLCQSIEVSRSSGSTIGPQSTLSAPASTTTADGLAGGRRAVENVSKLAATTNLPRHRDGRRLPRRRRTFLGAAHRARCLSIPRSGAICGNSRFSQISRPAAAERARDRPFQDSDARFALRLASYRKY
jgi:hypothetical protein